MVDAFERDGAVARRLRENEGALEDGLGMSCEARRRPIGRDPARRHGLRDIRLQRRCMAEDAGGAGLADRGMRPVNFLGHGPDETGELGEIAFDDRLAELDVTEQAVKRVVMLVVGRVLEER